MSDRITLSGLEVFAYHGVLDHEAQDGQTFLVDIDLHLNTANAAASDSVADTVDYGSLAAEVVGVVQGERCALIESVAHRVARHCMAKDLVEACSVTLHKPAAPIPHSFTDVSVTVRYPR